MPDIVKDLLAARGGGAREPAPGGPGEPPVIVCDRLVRIFSVAGVETQALQGLDLTLLRGELTALVGASGSGKTTLLNILAALDLPTGGRAIVDGHDLLAMGHKERLSYRRSTVGFLWQESSRNLFAHLTVAENIELPMRLARAGRAARTGRVAELIDLLRLEACRDRLAGTLSGGQQQQAAVGVALANRPAVLLADEPTGELDTETAADVFGALRAANAHEAVTVLVVTHDPAVSEQVTRTIAIRDGQISTEVLRSLGHGEHGAATQHAQEYTVLDRAGRLQLPADFISALSLRDRVRLALEPDHIGVFPDRDRPARPGER